MRLALLLVLLGAPQEAVFRAGAAASNITPPLGEPIVGGWTSPPATHIHDELHARCLVLDDGKGRLAFVACDNVGIPREVLDEARRIVREETGLPGERLLISSTHTHSATTARGDKPLEREYARFLVRRIADGVRRAIHNLEPARIGWGSALAPEHVFNRRYFMREGTKPLSPYGEEDKVLMNPGMGNPNVDKPAGPVDPEVSFVILRARKGDRPIALLANYSLHYVGGVPEGEVSADYFAPFAGRIGELLGAEPPFVGIMTNGTSGDVNNIDVLGKVVRRPPYEKMKEVARICFKHWLEQANVLFIIGGKSNNTDIFETFRAMADALREHVSAHGPTPLYVVIGRGGPNLIRGMGAMRDTMDALGLPYRIFGFDSDMSEVINYAKAADAWMKAGGRAELATRLRVAAPAA